MTLRKLFLLCTVSLSALMSQAATDPDKYATLSPDDIHDLPLIYIGSNHRSKWDKEILRPYVVHTFADGHSTWMFDGFLMVEFVVYSEDGSHSYSIDGDWPYGEPGKKEHWEQVLVNQLGLSTGTGCKAIDDLISELIPQLGEPARKHQIVFSLPVPTTATQTWGAIDGRNMNFESTDDRIFAINWYIDRILEKWEEADFKNLELAGVYWTQEAPSYGERTGYMATHVNDYAHSLGLKTYWIPYYSVRDRDKWREMNFDVAYTQPNYAFRTDVPYGQLEDAVDSSFELGLGVEMEFEGYNFTNNGGKIEKYPAPSCGLYDISPVFWNRVKDYIDVFEDLSAFDMLPIAYYAGYQAFYDYETSGNPKDKELMDRMAKLIEERHIITEWYESDNAGIDDVGLSDDSTVWGGDGFIYISDDACSNTYIYSVDGTMIFCSAGDYDHQRLSYGRTISARPGVYIVRNNGKTAKIMVK